MQGRLGLRPLQRVRGGRGADGGGAGQGEEAGAALLAQGEGVQEGQGLQGGEEVRHASAGELGEAKVGTFCGAREYS